MAALALIVCGVLVIATVLFALYVFTSNFVLLSAIMTLLVAASGLLGVVVVGLIGVFLLSLFWGCKSSK